MKKIILIFCAVMATLSLTAFGVINWSNTETDLKETTTSKTTFPIVDLTNTVDKSNDLNLLYNVDSRFINTITKEDLDNAKSIIDILPEQATRKIVSYHDVKVSILGDDSKTIESIEGEGDVLNIAQLNLLKSTAYTTNIFIGAKYKIKNPYYGDLEEYELTYYISIIPEKEAKYANHPDALIE